MKHDDIVEKLSEYRDGALGPSERAEISRHASACAECVSALSDLALLSKLFFPRPPAPTAFQTEGFVSRVMSRLPPVRPELPAWLTGRWLMPALGLSFGLLALSFLSAGGAEALDPASALLLSRADRATTASPRSETPLVDVLGLPLEDR